MIPGRNLLNMASGLIRTQPAMLLKLNATAINSMGFNVNDYDAPFPVKGSWQPVPMSMYQVQGLDFTKTYARFYTSNNVQGISRIVTGDVIEYDGRRWQAMDVDDWHKLDGWVNVLLVDIGPIPPEPEPEPEPE
jgi:hypothetical protein